MLDPFRDRTAVITGGAAGIGAGIARAMAARGARLVLADVDEQALAATARRLEAEGATVLPVRTDVGECSDVEALAEAAWKRFLREARSAAAVRHPHVCPIYDVGEHEGLPYVVMAYVEGQTLGERITAKGRCEDPHEAVFLGRQVTQHKQVSDVTAHAIDEEVRYLIDTNYKRAKDILESNLDKLHKMSEALIKYETIDEGQIKDIMEGRDPKPPAGWDDSATPFGGSGGGKGREREKGGEAPIGKPASQH